MISVLTVRMLTCFTREEHRICQSVLSISNINWFYQSVISISNIVTHTLACLKRLDTFPHSIINTFVLTMERIDIMWWVGNIMNRFSRCYYQFGDRSIKAMYQMLQTIYKGRNKHVLDECLCSILCSNSNQIIRYTDHFKMLLIRCCKEYFTK